MVVCSNLAVLVQDAKWSNDESVAGEQRKLVKHGESARARIQARYPPGFQRRKDRVVEAGGDRDFCGDSALDHDRVDVTEH